MSKLIVVFIMFFLLSACETEEVPQAIEIDSASLKDAYYISTFETDSIDVRVHYNEKTLTLPLDESMIVGNSELLHTEGTHTIDIEYEGLSTSFTLTLVDDSKIMNSARIYNRNLLVTMKDGVAHNHGPIDTMPISVFQDVAVNEDNALELTYADGRVETLETLEDYHIVHFKDGSHLLDVQFVKDGDAMDDFSIEKAGHTFDTWDHPLESVGEDIVVQGQWIPEEHIVMVYDSYDNLIDYGKVAHGESYVMPDLDVPDGFIFVEWSERTHSVKSDLFIRPHLEHDPDALGLVEYSRDQSIAFGTTLFTSYTYRDTLDTHAISSALQKESSRLESLLQHEAPVAEYTNLYTINNAPGEWHTLDPDLYAIIEMAVDAHAKTNGRFDITMGPINALYDKLDSGESPSEDSLQSAAENTGIDRIELDPQDKRVRVEEGTVLDLRYIRLGLVADALRDILNDQDGIEYFNIYRDLDDGNFQVFGNLDVNTEEQISYHQLTIPDTQPSRRLGVLEITSGTHLSSIYASGNPQPYGEVSDYVLTDPFTLERLDSYPLLTLKTQKGSLWADVYAHMLYQMSIETGMTFVNDMEDLEALWYVEQSKESVQWLPEESEGDYVYGEGFTVVVTHGFSDAVYSFTEEIEGPSAYFERLLADGKEALSIPLADLDAVDKFLFLPEETIHGISVEWDSDSEHIELGGTYGIESRRSAKKVLASISDVEEPTPFSLSATLQIEGISETKTFTGTLVP